MLQKIRPKIEERRTRTVELYIRGASIEKIAKELKTSRATIHRDLFALKEEITAKTKKCFAEETLFLFQKTNDVVLKEAWNAYQIASVLRNTSGMVCALNTVNKTMADRVDFMEKLNVFVEASSADAMVEQVKESLRKVQEYHGMMDVKREEEKKKALEEGRAVTQMHCVDGHSKDYMYLDKEHGEYTEAGQTKPRYKDFLCDCGKKHTMDLLHNVWFTIEPCKKC